MAKSWVLVMLGAFALLNSWEDVEGWKDDLAKVMHVTGKVMCQDCTKGWNHWAHGATPLEGCRVSVTCMDARRRVVHHASDETDEQGEFEMLLSKHINGKELSPEGCSVRLVSSPDPACGVATDFGRGHSGVKLHTPSHVYPGMVKYTVGPFYYTRPMCDEPDTSD